MNNEIRLLAMDHINKSYKNDCGFALWLESDMIPATVNWVGLLESEWKNYPNTLVMGLYFPKRYCIKSKALIPEYINGGACYAKDLSAAVPPEHIDACFDTALFLYIKKRRGIINQNYSSLVICIHFYTTSKATR